MICPVTLQPCDEVYFIKLSSSGYQQRVSTCLVRDYSQANGEGSLLLKHAKV